MHSSTLSLEYIGQPPLLNEGLSRGETSTSFEVLNDIIPEEQQCLTIRISPVNFAGKNKLEMFSCNEQGPSYFCEHTICIEDDDGKSLKLQEFLTFISPVGMVIGFSQVS